MHTLKKRGHNKNEINDIIEEVLEKYNEDLTLTAENYTKKKSSQIWVVTNS